MSEIVRKYYDSGVEKEWERLSKPYRHLELVSTLRLMKEHFPPSGRALDLGGGPGRYAIELARWGHRVTLFDLSAGNLALARRKGAEAGVALAGCEQGNATDLSRFGDGRFDAVLLMGPLYHLVLETDRVKALSEAHGRLEPGGLIFSALISRLGIMGHLLKHVPHWIENQKEVRSVMDAGHDPEHSPGGGFRGYYVVVDEIAPLHEHVGFETVVLAGVEPAISADDESYNKLEGTQRKLWLDLLYELSSAPSLVAGSRHLLYIGRKPGG